MTTPNAEPSLRRRARIAGLLYLLSSIPGAFCLIYVPSRFLVRGNAAATADRILSAQLLFRLGIVCELASFVGFIFVVRALYRLFKGVDQTQASLMVTLMLISLPVSFVNVVNEIAALILVRGTDYLAVFDKAQREALAMLFLDLHFHGFMVAQVFWGLWLFPFGILVMRSRFLPRFLGILLIIAMFGYLAGSLSAWHLLPHGDPLSQLTACELPIILWLLIFGAKEQPLALPVPSPAS